MFPLKNILFKPCLITLAFLENSLCLRRKKSPVQGCFSPHKLVAVEVWIKEGATHGIYRRLTRLSGKMFKIEQKCRAGWL